MSVMRLRGGGHITVNSPKHSIIIEPMNIIQSILHRFRPLHTGADAPYYELVRRLFGVRAVNIELYKLALVHKSASVALEDGTSINNERLEFLGDAVIQTIVSEMLFLDYPAYDEGDLSKLRSRIVSRLTLNRVAVSLGLPDIVSAHPSNVGIGRQNLYGDALEALIGALYLDQGFDIANRVVAANIFAREIDIESMIATERDFKSRVVEWGQKYRFKVEFRSTECADHRDLAPHFECRLVVCGKECSHGEGRSKKEAEQIAAQYVYAKRERLVPIIRRHMAKTRQKEEAENRDGQSAEREAV